MKIAASSITLLAGTLCPSAALAEDTPFETFQKLCLERAGKPAQSLAVAEALGWKPTPPALLETIMKGSFVRGDVSSRDGRTAPSARQSLAVGRAVMTTATYRIAADACVLAAPDADIPTLKAAAARFTGFAPVMTDKESAMYIWRETGTGREAVTEAEVRSQKSNAERTRI